ncbi:MAG TPA: glycosyltransferase [Thermoanaerobaculia bacterium]|jgi:hypothetical protein
MKTKTRSALGVLFLGFALALAVPTDALAAEKADDLRAAMRRLWEDHVTWTRLYIVSTLAGLPDNAATTARLLQNQTDIGNAIKPFYGDAAGTRLTALLKDHILIAADIVQAAKSGDGAKLDPSKARWTANADDIAAFLSSANPRSWPAADVKAMMHDHLAATAAELEARLKKDWNADVAAYDRVHEQILKMADMLSEGIVRQFPQKVA